MPDAWLFDVYPHPRQSALVVWVWHEGRATKRVVPYQPDFCVAAREEPLETAEKALRHDPRVERMWRSKSRLWLRGPEQEVLRVRPKRLQDIFAVASDLRKATHTTGFEFYDVDHSPESRWTHAQGLWVMCRLHVGPKGPELRPAAGEDRWEIEYPTPGLTVLRLEVEATQVGHQPDWADPLVAVRLSEGGPGGATTEFRCAAPGDAQAERACLLAFNQHMRRVDPDVLTTRHGDRFDIPYLLRRIRMHGLQDEVWLGRAPDVEADRPDQQGKSIHTYGRWLYKTHAYYLRGRWHIDLAKKTLDSEEDRKDLHGILYLCRLANRRAQDVNRNGAGFALQQMQIDLATDWGVALPWKRNLAEDWKDAATLCAVDRGGQIMVPTPGIYEDVAACDFSGYYPSLVVRHNLSSDAMNCACCPDGEVVPELGYHVCRTPGHQSTILSRMWGHRRWAKSVLKRAKNTPPTKPGRQ